MARGELRVYLGAAPGVGKTFRMLGEGQRRLARGGDVVIGLLETHGRQQTAAAAEGLEVVPRKQVTYRGTTFEEMDVEAVVARHPELALVDELAHTNVPGIANDKRWQDVVALLNAGINVITTVNIQHLESVNDVVERITGVPQRETVPDAVVRAAAQVELVDMTAEALRRRLAHGNVYAPDKVDAALAHYFRVGNLTALRELALLWLADSVEEGLKRYRAEHDIDVAWETRERVVVALSGGPEGEQLVRRAARISTRGGADLIAVHVARTDGLSGAPPAELATQQALVESFGGRYAVLAGDDPSSTVLAFAKAENATQLVVGASRRSRLQRMVGGLGTAAGIVDLSGPIDVHIVTHGERSRGWGPRLGRDLPVRRRLTAVVVATLGLVGLTLLMTQVRHGLTLSSITLVYLLLVVGVSLLGGIAPAVGTAVGASVVVNWYFTPPIHSFTIEDRNNAVALVVFVVVAVVVSAVVDLAARRTEQAARSASEAEILSGLAGTALAEDPLGALVAQARQVFHAESVLLLDDDEAVPAGATAEPTGDGARLVVCRTLSGDDARLLRAFAAQAGIVSRTQRLAREAAAAHGLEAADQVRTALLSAVGHDLRTPLTAIKASVAGLLDDQLSVPAADRRELLEAIDTAADRLTGLVGDLMELGRLATGAVQPVVTATDIAQLTGDAEGVRVTLPEAPAQVLVDPVLTRRILDLLVGNAPAYGGPTPVLVRASCLGDRMEVRVDQRDPALNLELALARALAEAQGGSLEPEDTPGGGVTLVLTLPLVR